MKITMEKVPYYSVNPSLSPKVKKYATLEGARSREGDVFAWDYETGEYIPV